MINNLKNNKILWGVTTLLTFFAAIYGLIDNNIYSGLFPLKFIAAQFSQDWLTIAVCIFLGYLILSTKPDSIKRPVIIIGIMGSLAYLYGIFSIERVYNVLYLVYLAILGTSFFSVVFAISSLNQDVLKTLEVKKGVKYTTAVFSLLIAALFSLLWISALLPLMATKTQIQNLFSIYLLDLVFVMPSFVITAVMTFRKNPLGYVLTPSMFILGIFVIFPLGLGELAKPMFGLSIDYQGMMMSFLLSAMFLIGAIWQLAKLHAVQKN
jgi:hypothetical protein